jgi:hypothetical protein
VLHDSVGTDFEPLVGWEIMSAWGLGGTVLWQLLELVLRRVGSPPWTTHGRGSSKWS